MYTTREAARIAGAKFRNVDYWAKTGVATASVPARGTGSDRLYSYEDLFVLYAMAKLADDTSIATRKEIGRSLRESGWIADPKCEFFTVEISPCVEIWLNLKRIREAILTGLSAIAT